MQDFAALLEHLIFSPRRQVKLTYLADWLKHTPDPDRGYGLAALTGALKFKSVKAGLVRDLASQIIDPELFALSYDFVGDLAETTALLWPERTLVNAEPLILRDVVAQLEAANRTTASELIRDWLYNLPEAQRWALLKLATGGMRVGVSARMVRLAIADAYDKPVEDIEEIWPILSIPYIELFDWLEGKAPRPNAEGRAVFRPLMLAHPLEEADLSKLNLTDYQIEWKWDGARVQLVSADDSVRLFSRSGDEINASFPELVAPLDWRGVLDGELLAGTPQAIGSFQDLQQRLNRKKPTAKLQQAYPVFIRAYDILFDEDTDLRGLPLKERRQILDKIIPRLSSDKIDSSDVINGTNLEALNAMREACRTGGLIEGLMLKKQEGSYKSGRIKGEWFKWKRDPLTADVVVMYAQRGHGKRSSFYSDFTFGAWRDGEDGAELVPVGKAYSGFTDIELKRLDKFVRENTTQKFGPVREVKKELVVEVAFDSLSLSNRHKSGLSMRFPRFHAIRWDKPADEADTVEGLMSLLDI